MSSNNHDDEDIDNEGDVTSRSTNINNNFNDVESTPPPPSSSSILLVGDGLMTATAQSGLYIIDDDGLEGMPLIQLII